MIYYLDSEYRVHTEPGEDRVPWEDTDGIFNGKCEAYIKGFHVIPEDKKWMREDGAVFVGKMITPWKPYSELNIAQRQYELQQLEDMKNAIVQYEKEKEEAEATIAELDAILLESIYQNIVSDI